MKSNNDTSKKAPITLRPFQEGDDGPCFEAVQESINELSPWLWWCPETYSVEDCRLGLESSMAAWKDGVEYSFGIFDSENGSFIGSCGVNNINAIDRFANLGYWVRTSRAKEGIATMATPMVARFAFKELGPNRLEIVVATENTGSQHVAAKVGAQREGILRRRMVVHNRVYDAVMFSLIEEDLPENINALETGGQAKLIPANRTRPRSRSRSRKGLFACPLLLVVHNRVYDAVMFSLIEEDLPENINALGQLILPFPKNGRGRGR